MTVTVSIACLAARARCVAPMLCGHTPQSESLALGGTVRTRARSARTSVITLTAHSVCGVRATLSPLSVCGISLGPRPPRNPRLRGLRARACELLCGACELLTSAVCRVCAGHPAPGGPTVR